MASQFNTYMRKNQRTIIAVVGVVLIITWVVGPFLLDAVGVFGPSNTGDKTVVTYRGGKITENNLQRMRLMHQLAVQLCTNIVGTTMQRGGTPSAPMLSVDPRSGRIFSPGIDTDSSDRALVQRTILARKAREMGVVVDQAAVKQFLFRLSDESLGEGDWLDIAKNIIPGESRVSVGQLLEHMEEELLAQHMQILMRSSLLSFPTTEVWDYHNRLDRRATIEAYAVNVKDFIDKVPEPKPGDPKLLALFDEGKFRDPDPSVPEPGFHRPERISFGFFKVDFKYFEDEAKKQITEEQIKAEYDLQVSQGKHRVEPAEVPTTDAPAVEKPATETPATDAPATEKPAEEAKPAEEKPAEAPATEAPKPEDANPETPAEEAPAAPAADEKPAAEEKPAEEKPEGGCQEEPAAAADPAAPATEEKPAEEKPADEKPADAPAAPASETPAPSAEEKPAEEAKPEEKPAEPAAPAAETPAAPTAETPAAETPVAPPTTPPAPAVKPLAEVREEILTMLAQPIATQLRSEAIKGAVDEVRKFSREYNTAKIRLENKNGGPLKEGEESSLPTLDIEAIAKKYHFTSGVTEPISESEAPETELGQNAFTFSQMSFQDFATVAFAGNDQLYNPSELMGGSNASYIYFRMTQTPAADVTYADVEAEVVAAYRKQQALELAKEEAQKIVDQVKAAGSVEKAIGDVAKVIKPAPFSWYTTGFMSMGMGMGAPSLSPVDGIRFAGREFMEPVFAIKPGETTIAVDQPRETVYVVRMVSDDPPEEIRREKFLETGMSPQVGQIAQMERMESLFIALEALETEYKVKWSRLPGGDMAGE